MVPNLLGARRRSREIQRFCIASTLGRHSYSWHPMFCQRTMPFRDIQWQPPQCVPGSRLGPTVWVAAQLAWGGIPATAFLASHLSTTTTPLARSCPLPSSCTDSPSIDAPVQRKRFSMDSFKPDAIVVDLDLGPGPTGLDVVRALARMVTEPAVIPSNHRSPIMVESSFPTP